MENAIEIEQHSTTFCSWQIHYGDADRIIKAVLQENE